MQLRVSDEADLILTCAVLYKYKLISRHSIQNKVLKKNKKTAQKFLKIGEIILELQFKYTITKT